MKKIRGKLYYFGLWSAPEGSPARYLEQLDARHAGRKSRPHGDALTVKELAIAFLNPSKDLMEAGEQICRTGAMTMPDSIDIDLLAQASQEAIKQRAETRQRPIATETRATFP